MTRSDAPAPVPAAPRPRSRRRLVAGLLAATTAIVPIALWAAPPAAAAGPVSLEVSPDGCTVTGTGDGYDSLSLSFEGDGFDQSVDTTVGPTISANYGEHWIVPTGTTYTFELTGRIGSIVAETVTAEVGACMTGQSIQLSAANLGTPAAGFTGYDVGVKPCSSGRGFGRFLLEPGTTRTVPVLPGVEYCAVANREPGVFEVTSSPASVTLANGANVAVTVTGDWLGTAVRFEKVWVVGGQVVAGPPAGVDTDHFEITWTSLDGATAVASGGCDYEVGGDEDADSSKDASLVFGCDDDAARIRDAGTVEVVETGAPGWQLQEATFDVTDCIAAVDSESGEPVCLLRLVNEPVAAAPPGGGSGGGGGGAPAEPEPVDLGCEPGGRPFADVDPDSTHGATVACAADLGLLLGGPEGLPADEFGPTRTTSRAQLASIVANLLDAGGVVLPAAPADVFADDDGSVHETNIDRLVAAGIVDGNGEDGASYFPTRPATRAEVASFLARAYAAVAGTPLPAGPDAFADDDGHPLEDEIEALAAAGVLVGKAPGAFDPEATVTREQLASLLVGLVERLAADGAW